jgi:hypothetical protein
VSKGKQGRFFNSLHHSKVVRSRHGELLRPTPVIRLAQAATGLK